MMASFTSGASGKAPESKCRVPEGSPSPELNGEDESGAGVKSEIKLPKLTSDNYRLLPPPF